MFVVLLKFVADKARAGEFMDAHKAWIKRGFDDAANRSQEMKVSVGGAGIEVTPYAPAHGKPRKGCGRSRDWPSGPGPPPDSPLRNPAARA